MSSRNRKILAAWMSDRECSSCISKRIVIISSIGEWECLAFCTGNIHLSSVKCINVFVLLYDCWLAVLPVRLLLILMMVFLVVCVWVCFYFLIRPIQFYCSRHSQACLGKECAAHMALSHHFNSHFIHTILRLQNYSNHTIIITIKTRTIEQKEIIHNCIQYKR